MKKRALISVFDKEGVLDFAQALSEMGWEIVSTGGTSRMLKEAGVPVVGISEVTGFPEILGGRVKTLHPKVHGGILARQDDSEHMQELESLRITPISLVAVNLYPFEKTVAKPDVTPEDAQENIDIGGVCLLRAAGKNYPSVLIVSDPKDYPKVLEALKNDAVTEPMRIQLAVKAFQHTAHYDTAISEYLQTLV